MPGKSMLRTWWFYALLLCVLLGTCLIVLFTLVVRNASRMNAPQPAGAIIVLGAQVYESGEPSPALARRLSLARELYEAGYAPLIITTGAQGDNEPLPEGDAMKQYLVARGIPEGAVLSETQSFNTRENLQNAKALLDARGISSAILVTSDYHLWRALSMWADLGMEGSGAGSQNALTRGMTVRNWLRETASWVKYLITR